MLEGQLGSLKPFRNASPWRQGKGSSVKPRFLIAPIHLVGLVTDREVELFVAVAEAPFKNVAQGEQAWRALRKLAATVGCDEVVNSLLPAERECEGNGLLPAP